MIKNGIILSGGNGSRLSPINESLNKHMIPIGNKFIIDYPLMTMQEMGVENLTIVLGGNFFEQVVKYIKGGKAWNFNINYVYQETPAGIAQAIDLCKDYVGDDKFSVCLGDNWFEKPVIWKDLPGAQVVLHKHPHLQQFGVASIKDGKIMKIEEKPSAIYYSFDNYAIAGCYLFDQMFFEYFKDSKPSRRGEYEITEIIEKYNKADMLNWTIVDGGWSDMGTFDSIGFVSDYIYTKNKVY